MKSAALAAAAISAGQVVHAKQSEFNPFPAMGEDEDLCAIKMRKRHRFIDLVCKRILRLVIRCLWQLSEPIAR